MTLKDTASNPAARMLMQSVIGVITTATFGGVVWLGSEIHDQNAHLSRLEMRVTGIEGARLTERTTVLEVQRAGDQALLSQQMTELRGVLAQVGADMRALSARLDAARHTGQSPQRSQ
jgi:uncharacterized coiled-coil protein SlyX